MKTDAGASAGGKNVVITTVEPSELGGPSSPAYPASAAASFGAIMKTFSTIGLALAGILGLSACSSSPGTGAGGAGGGGTSTSTATGGAGNGKIGDACAATADCEMGDNCATTDPGGQCVKACAAQADCPMGSTCTDEKKCYKACAAATDCPRMGYACVDAMTATAMATKVCDIAP